MYKCVQFSEHCAPWPWMRIRNNGGAKRPYAHTRPMRPISARAGGVLCRAGLQVIKSPWIMPISSSILLSPPVSPRRIRLVNLRSLPLLCRLHQAPRLHSVAPRV